MRATEEGSGGTGYEFAAYSETSPYSALGRVRDKMRRGLATRYITGGIGDYQMTHDRVFGRISSDGDTGVVLFIDGIPLSMEDFAKILRSHEGWAFELKIVDAGVMVRVQSRLSNFTLDRTAGSHALAAAGQRGRWASL